MASHEQVAEWHASLFPSGETVVDATCGIGADTIALAKRGPVIGLDLQVEHARYAQHNLDVCGLHAEIVHTDCLEWLRSNSPKYVYADPARRDGSRRTLNPDEFVPNLGELLELLARCKLAVIKLSPMLDDGFLESLGGKLIFVSHRGECKEALIVLGEESGRFAYQLESAQYIPACHPPASTEVPLEYLFEADPAAIRAHALGDMGLLGLGDSHGYLTGSTGVESLWLTSYQVLWHGTWRPKAVKSYLLSENLYVESVKTRGVQVDPRAVQKMLNEGKSPKPKKGHDTCVLALYPVGKSIRSVILKRC